MGPNIRPKRPRLTKIERRDEQKKKVNIHLGGAGAFVYRNTMNGGYRLPKPAKDLNGNVIRDVPAGAEFIGDSYFKILIGQGVALVRTLEEPFKVPAPLPTLAQNERTVAEAKATIAKAQAAMDVAQAAMTPKTVLTEGTNMSEEKLICDQPDRVTSAGTVEHVVVKKNKKLNEQERETEGGKPQPDVLIVENPLSGVEIL
jgi:hypothetical protein